MKNTRNESLQEVSHVYQSYDAKTDEFLSELRKNDPDSGDRFDLKVSGCGLAILSEAVIALRNAHLIMRATRMSDGKDEEETARVIYNLARLLNAYIMMYIDDCGLNHDVFIKMSDEDAKHLATGDMQEAAEIIDKYFEAYKAVYPGSVTPDMTFADVLYSHESKS